MGCVWKQAIQFFVGRNTLVNHPQLDRNNYDKNWSVKVISHWNIFLQVIVSKNPGCTSMRLGLGIYHSAVQRLYDENVLEQLCHLKVSRCEAGSKQECLWRKWDWLSLNPYELSLDQQTVEQIHVVISIYKLYAFPWKIGHAQFQFWSANNFHHNEKIRRIAD